MTASILIADDDTNLLRMLKEYLQYRGFSVHTVLDGRQLILSAHELKPDLIIMDINMPSISGSQAFSALKASKNCAGVPVILLSGVRVEEGIKISESNERVRFIRKPVSMSNLESVIDELLGSSIIVDYEPAAGAELDTVVLLAGGDPWRLSEKLSQKGFKVYSCPNAQDALKQAIEIKPDVIVAGMETAGEIKTAAIPVIFISKQGDAAPDKDIEERISQGLPAMVLSGPVTAERIVGAVRSLLEN